MIRINNFKNKLFSLLDRELILKKNGYQRDGYLFEIILSEIYKGNGYKINITGGSYDAGVDLIAEKNNKRIAIQAKNYGDNMIKKDLRKKDIYNIFHKIKNEGENKYGQFTNARLHIYNDNISCMKPRFIENINQKFNYDIDEKAVYGKTWISHNLEILNQESLDKISNIILYDRR